MNSLRRIRLLGLSLAIFAHLALIVGLVLTIQPKAPVPIPLITIDLATFEIPASPMPAKPSKKLAQPPIEPTDQSLPSPEGAKPESKAIQGAASPVGDAAPPSLAPASDPGAELARLVRERIQSNLVYPESARRRGISGLVQLEITVTADGYAQSILVRNSSGSAILDNAAKRLAASILPVPIPVGINGPTTVRIRVSYTLASAKNAVSSAL